MAATTAEAMWTPVPVIRWKEFASVGVKLTALDSPDVSRSKSGGGGKLS